MLADGVLHLHNEPGIPAIRVCTKQFMCIGSLPPFDHPHVFLDVGDDSQLTCPYCSTVFKYDPTLQGDCEPAECAFVSGKSDYYRYLVSEGVRSDNVNISDIKNNNWFNLNIRQVSGIISAVCVIISFIDLIRSNSITEALLWWFFLLLSIFHLIFFSATSVTQKHVKLIDYPYLLFGVFGVWLAFMASQDARDKYATALDEYLAPSTSAGLKNYIQDMRTRFCIQQAGYVPDSFCQSTYRLFEFLSHDDYTPKQLDQEINEFRDSATVGLKIDSRLMSNYYVAMIKGVRPIGLMSAISRAFRTSRIIMTFYLHPQATIEEISVLRTEPVFVVYQIAADSALIVNSMRKIHKGMAGTIHEKSDAPALEPVVIGLGKELVWPFVLAIALALRLTKVTADVLGWAKAA